MNRLETVAKDLADLVEHADDDSRRSAAVVAAEFALERAGLLDQRAGDALQAVRERRCGDTPERAAAEALASALDDLQSQLQVRADLDEVSPEEHLSAFGRARAASSVFYAGDSDARMAALEAIYEACAVVDDLDDLRSVIAPVLG